MHMHYLQRSYRNERDIPMGFLRERFARPVEQPAVPPPIEVACGRWTVRVRMHARAPWTLLDGSTDLAEAAAIYLYQRGLRTRLGGSGNGIALFDPAGEIVADKILDEPGISRLIARRLRTT
jgi:hypothetical protein